MSVTKKIYIIAGEPSGDNIGGQLIHALKQLQNNYCFYGIGGMHMKKGGLKSLFPMSELSIMGVFEILPHILHLRQRIKETVDHIIAIQPDILVTIDSSGFTHRVIKQVKKIIVQKGLKPIPAVHYAAPPVWAWRPWRAKEVATFLDHLLCLFPFEPQYFRPYGLKTTFVGHPLISQDIINVSALPQIEHDQKRKTVLLLPGSRVSEIKTLLPIFISVAQQIPEQEKIRFVLVTLSHLRDLIASFIPPDMNIFVLSDMGEKDAAFRNAHSAIAASGTVSLELASFGVPHVVAYKTNFLTGILLKFLIRTPYVALPNIIAQQMIVPELLQKNCTPKHILKAYRNLDFAYQKTALHNVCKKLYPNANYASTSAHCARIIEDIIHGTA